MGLESIYGPRERIELICKLYHYQAYIENTKRAYREHIKLYQANISYTNFIKHYFSPIPDTQINAGITAITFLWGKLYQFIESISEHI